MTYGISVKQDTGGTRVVVRSRNQAGVLYAVPAEGTWVASPEQLHAHALAGFFGDLVKRDDPGLRALMNKWGLSFRELPLEDGGDEPAEGGAG